MIDKKELKKRYKQYTPSMGVFQIKNLDSGKIFVGSSRNLAATFSSLKFQLKHGLYRLHGELQRDYMRLGEEKFSFLVLDYLEPKKEPAYDPAADLAVLEGMWMEKLQPYGERGYNMMRQHQR